MTAARQLLRSELLEIGCLIAPAFLKITEGINPTIAEERPVRSRCIDKRQITVDDGIRFRA
jgi:hypothetical protein